VRVAGTTLAPTLNGRLDVDDGVFRARAWPQALTGLRAGVSFDERRITLDRLDARLGGAA